MALIETDGPQFPVPGMESVEADVYSGYQDYYGYDRTETWYFPDGKQYIEFQPLNEGQRSKYEASTSRDVRFNRRTDDAAIKMDAAADRKMLVGASVTGWHNVKRNAKGDWEPQAFGKAEPGGTFWQWYNKADPSLINQLYQAIRKANSWMTDDMTVEMIDEEIARLNEMREQVLEREAKEKN